MIPSIVKSVSSPVLLFEAISDSAPSRCLLQSQAPGAPHSRLAWNYLVERPLGAVDTHPVPLSPVTSWSLTQG